MKWKVNDDVYEEQLEGSRHARRTEVTEQMAEEPHVRRLVGRVKPEHDEGPDIRVVRKHREGCLDVAHTHEMVQLQEPGDLGVGVERVP